MVTSDGYLTSGVGYAHHPHRDTWYSAPMAQLNWWLPIYDIETEQSMAFHPYYFDKPIKNGSAEFNYYEWNAVGRKGAATQIKTDTRKQPKPEEELTHLDPQLRLVPPAGGIVLFSPQHLHSTVANTSGRRATASTSARSTGSISRRGAARRTSTATAPAPRCATSAARRTPLSCRTS